MRAAAVVVGATLALAGCGGDAGGEAPSAESESERDPLVTRRFDGARLWTAVDGSVELAVQILPASPRAGERVTAHLEAVDRRGGLANVAIVWGDAAEGPVPIPGGVVADCVAGAETPGLDEPDERRTATEHHVYDRAGEYTITAVAIGAGCGYSHRAEVRERLPVGEADGR